MCVCVFHTQLSPNKHMQDVSCAGIDCKHLRLIHLMAISGIFHKATVSFCNYHFFKPILCCCISSMFSKLFISIILLHKMLQSANEKMQHLKASYKARTMSLPYCKISTSPIWINQFEMLPKKCMLKTISPANQCLSSSVMICM